MALLNGNEERWFSSFHRIDIFVFRAVLMSDSPAAATVHFARETYNGLVQSCGHIYCCHWFYYSNINLFMVENRRYYDLGELCKLESAIFYSGAELYTKVSLLFLK